MKIKINKIPKLPKYEVEVDGEVVSQHVWKYQANNAVRQIKKDIEQMKKNVERIESDYRPISPPIVPPEPTKKSYKWEQYITPEAKGYRDYFFRDGRKIPTWRSHPLPPTPKVKYEDYKDCEWIELNDAVKKARKVARELKFSSSYGSRPSIMNWATERGVKVKRQQEGGGKEGIYIPVPLVDEKIANLRELRKRYPR